MSPDPMTQPLPRHAGKSAAYIEGYAACESTFTDNTNMTNPFLHGTEWYRGFEDCWEDLSTAATDPKPIF